MNMMEHIAKNYNLELGEIFQIKEYNKNMKFQFTEDGLMGKETGCWNYTNDTLARIIAGKVTVEKLPYIPLNGNIYYSSLFSDEDEVVTLVWGNNPFLDKFLLKNGLVYKTCLDAQAGYYNDKVRLID